MVVSDPQNFLVSSHVYMVNAAWGDGAGGWLVQLYNPWGKDETHNGNSIPFIHDGVNDGYITITWDTFKDYFRIVHYI